MQKAFWVTQKHAEVLLCQSLPQTISQQPPAFRQPSELARQTYSCPCHPHRMGGASPQWDKQGTPPTCGQLGQWSLTGGAPSFCNRRKPAELLQFVSHPVSQKVAQHIRDALIATCSNRGTLRSPTLLKEAKTCGQHSVPFPANVSGWKHSLEVQLHL